MTVEDLSIPPAVGYDTYLQTFGGYWEIRRYLAGSISGTLVTEYLAREAAGREEELRQLAGQDHIREAVLSNGYRAAEMYQHLKREGGQVSTETRAYYLGRYAGEVLCAGHLAVITELNSKEARRLKSLSTRMGKEALTTPPISPFDAVGGVISSSSVGAMIRDRDISGMLAFLGSEDPYSEDFIRMSLDVRVRASNGEGELIRSRYKGPNDRKRSDQYMVLRSPAQDPAAEEFIDEILPADAGRVLMDAVIQYGDLPPFEMDKTDQLLNERAIEGLPMSDASEGEIGLLRAVAAESLRRLMSRPVVVAEMVRNLGGNDVRHRLLSIFMQLDKPLEAANFLQDIIMSDEAVSGGRPGIVRGLPGQRGPSADS